MAEAGALFREAEMRAERTVGLLRMVVAVVLAIAFVGVVGLAPPDELALGRQLTIAAATLAGYLGVGLLAWSLARGDRLRPWMSWLFATLDVLVVVASLELGLLNVGAPGGYVAIMPVVWLAPLVLAFGALRYNPALQAYVTAILLSGLALGALRGAIWERGAPRPELGGALAFLFGGPPNLMRLTMLALTGVVLVLAAYRARKLLLRAIEQTRRSAALGRYLPPEIASWLAETSPEELRRGRRQTVAVLFADIRGFTGLAEGLDPDALGRLVSGFRARVTRAATRQGAVIDKFIGDAAMILVGVPQARADDAARALACAEAIHTEITVWNAERLRMGEPPLRVGIGVHLGEVFAGAVGDDSRLEFTVLGDTVNVAARIADATKTEDVDLLVSGALLEAAGETPETGWRALPAQALRGRRAQIALFARTDDAD